MHELAGAPEARLDTLIAKLSPVDLLLIEGFKHDVHDKIEVVRADSGNPPLYPTTSTVVAIASDRPLPDADRPVLDLDDVPAIADFIIAHCGLGDG